MTEALNPNSSMHPTTGAVSGEVLLSPVNLTGIRNVTPGFDAPRASLGNLSADMMGGPSLKNKAAAVIIVFGMLGGAKLASDSQPTRGQEPSAAPSAAPELSPAPSVTPDPKTGLLPCPTPTPEPEETPLPDRTIDPGIGVIPPGEVLYAQGQNSDGSIVTLTIAAQAEPSAAPSAPASPAASEGPKTALNPNCEPLPALNIEQEKNKIINQKDKQIKAVKYGTIEKAILGDPENLEQKPGFWNKHEAELSEYTVTTGLRKPFTREYLVDGLGNLKNGFEGTGDNKGAIMQTRQETAAAAVKLFILIADWTKNPEIRREALRIADMIFDHGVKGINTTQSYSENLDFMKYLVEDMFFVE